MCRPQQGLPASPSWAHMFLPLRSTQRSVITRVSTRGQAMIWLQGLSRNSGAKGFNQAGPKRVAGGRSAPLGPT